MPGYLRTPNGNLVLVDNIATVQASTKHLALTDKNRGGLLDYFVCPSDIAEAFRDAIIALILNPDPRGSVAQPDWVAIALRINPQWVADIGWTDTGER